MKKESKVILGYKVERPFIISGPCGAETEEQVIETALELAKQPIHLMRAGIWKPRTRPNAFQGAGEVALEWVKQASKLTGIPVTVEVSNHKHVEAALKAGIDVLWIGARTTVNPFTVQEIADSLHGVDIPIMIKNPVNPDLELWIGAIERIAKAGIKNIAVIHRGFSSYEKTIYRNRPNWEIPIEFMRRMPEIPIICDPSHICGKRELLLAVSQVAMDLNYDGLMIESHINPDKALSDAKQQITPVQLGELLGKLICRSTSIDDILTLRMIEGLREKMDKIDFDILDLISKRMDIAKAIGQYKKENNITILQAERWDEVVQNRMLTGLEKELDKDFVKKLFEIIHQESINQQTIIMNADTNEIKSTNS
ncbi:MAG: chorismate mutase [Bacteroidota bacterium]